MPNELIAIGEIGLAGECRAVSHIEQRIKEIERLGFKKVLIPHRNLERIKNEKLSIELLGIKSVFEVLSILKPPQNKQEN